MLSSTIMLFQSQPLQILGYIFEIIAIVAGILTAILIFAKKSKYLANIFMAFGNLFIGLYVAFILAYDIIGEAWAIQTFLPIAMCCILIGTLMIFFSMLCIVKSDKWFDIWYRWMPYVLIVIAYGVYILTNQNFITILDTEVVNTQINFVPLGILVGLLLFFLGASEYIVIVFGIKKTEGDTKKNMKLFSTGTLFGILAILFNVVSQIVAEGVLGELFDVLFFGVLAVCVVFLSIALGQK